MSKCNRETVWGSYMPCHRAEGHTGPCAHNLATNIYIVEELNQWSKQPKTIFISHSLIAAQTLLREIVEGYNRPYQPGYVEYDEVDCVPHIPRLAEDWQYHPVYPEYWKNGKGHYLKLSTYKV